MLFKKNLYAIVGLIFLGSGLLGQNGVSDIDMDLNLLQAPQSPAATLLGIADSEISRPTDVTDFMMGLKQATDNFTALPVNYAIDLSPVWLLDAGSVSGDEFLSNSLKNNIPQSFVLSFAVNTDDVTGANGSQIENTAVAVGAKVSLLRGNIKSTTKTALDKAYNLAVQNNKSRAEIYTTALDSSAKYQAVFQQIQNLNSSDSNYQDEVKVLQLQAELIQKEISAQVDQQIADNSQDFIDISKDFDFSRVGFKLDLQGALAWDFPDKVYADRHLTKAGAWLTAALEGNNNLSFLVLGRFQHMPNELVMDTTGMGEVSIDALDAGARLLYNKNRFSFSGEIIYRDRMGDTSLDGSTKWAINAEYAVSSNQKLILSYGKDFDGTVSENGNVLAALNFLMGFGSKRKVGTGGQNN